MGPTHKVALVTGASSGIGQASALALRDAGFVVFAGARNGADLDGLAAAGLRPVHLEVTDEASRAEAVAAAEAETGAVAVLVNNAGYGLYGPVEQQPLDEARRQLEVNLLGPVRLCQLVLPGMRANGGGRIVNLSSIAGRLSMPGAGHYHASKAALETLSDSLRMEVAGFNVAVSLVEPGPVATAWSARAAATLDHAVGPAGAADPYEELKAHLRSWLDAIPSHAKKRLASSPAQVAAAVVRAATEDAPRARYVVGPVARALLAVRPLLPDRAWDAAVSAVVSKGATSRRRP